MQWVGQWVKRWQTDLAAPGRVHVGGHILNHKRGSIAHRLSLSNPHCPNMTDTLL